MLASSPGEQGRSVMVRGVVLYGRQLAEYAERHGLCPLCAETVVRRRPNFWSTWEPLTIKDPVTDEYRVYKGYCIQPYCYTLDQAKKELKEPVESRNRRKPRTGKLSGDTASSPDFHRPMREPIQDATVTVVSPGNGAYLGVERYPQTSPSPGRQPEVTFRPRSGGVDSNTNRYVNHTHNLPSMPTITRAVRSERSPPRNRLGEPNSHTTARSERPFRDYPNPLERSNSEITEDKEELENIESIENLRRYAGKSDFVNFMVEMDLHHFKASVAKEGFQLLRDAVMEIHKSKPNSYLFTSDTWVKTIKTALLAKSANKETTIQGLLVFMSFSGLSPAYRRDVLQYPTVDAILTVREKFRDDVEIEELCCACLEVLFADNSDVEWRLKSADGEKVIEALITVMNTRDNCDHAVRALFNLSAQEHFTWDGLPVADRVNTALAANHGAEVLNGILQKDGLSDLVAEAALYFLWRLSLPSPNEDGLTFQSGSGIIPTEKVIQATLNAMTTREESSLVQQAACGILCNLMLPSNTVQYPPSMAKATVEAISKALSGHLDLSAHSDVTTLQMVHLNGNLAIHNLLCNVQLRNAVMSDAHVLASLIITSMNLFTNKPVIQAVGCMALSRVCGMGLEQKRAVLDAGGIDAIATAFRKFVMNKSTEEKNARSIFDGACTVASSLSILPEGLSALIRSDLITDIQGVFLRDPSIAASPSAELVAMNMMTMANSSDPEALLSNVLESSSNVGMAESCFSALASSAVQSDDVLNKILACHEGHGVDCLLDVMGRFPNSTVVQQEGIAILALIYCNRPFKGVLGNVTRSGSLVITTHTEREVDVIRNAMRRHRSHPGIQENAFLALSNFIAPICGASNDFDNVASLFAPSLKDVQEAIVLNRNEPSVYKCALRFFWSLTFVCREDDMQVWALRIMQNIFDCMRRYPDDDEMQLIGCEALLGLLDDEKRLEFVSCGERFETVFKCINLPNEAVVARSCEIIARLLSDYFPASNQLLEMDNAIEQLISYIVKYVASEEIQMQLCSIMKSLVTLQDHVVKHMIAGCDGLKSFLDSAIRHRRNQVLVEDAVLAMTGVARALNKNVIKPMRSSLGNFILRVIEENMDCATLEAATLSFLFVLCALDEYFKKLISDSNAIPQIIDVMNQHLAEAELQLAGCSILWVLAKDIKENIGRCGGIRAVVNAMNAHTTHTALQKEALTAIKNLATAPENNASILQYGAEDAVIRVLWINMQYPQVLSAGFSALNNIAVDSGTKSVSRMQEAALELIVHSMKRFPTNENVQKNAVFLLKSYSYFEDNLRLLFFRADDLVPLLANAAESFPKDCHDRAFNLMRKIEQMALDR